MAKMKDTIVNELPEFPLKVIFFTDHIEDDEMIWILGDLKEVACNLEWFDSDDPEENAVVIDNKNRVVNLKVVALEVIRFELKK